MNGEGQITAEPVYGQQIDGSQATESNVETQPVGAIFVGRKAQEIDAQLEEIKARGNKEEAERFFGINNGVNDLFSVNHPEIVGEEGFKDGVTKINVQGGDRAIQDVKIDENNNAVYGCKVDGIEGYIKVPREVIRNILLVEKRDGILSLFPGDERKAVEDYISGLADRSIPLSTSWRAEEIQEQNNQEKSPEDRLIDDSIENIKKEIESLKASGQDVRDKETLLAHLELANNAKGELGIFFKTDAVQRLKAFGVEGISREEIDKALEELNFRLGNANEKFTVYLDKCGISREQQRQLIEIVKTGDIEKLIINEHFSKIKDLDKLIFGKEMNELELMDLLSTKEKASYLFKMYGKKGLMGVLLMLLLGIVQAADLAKGELGAR